MEYAKILGVLFSLLTFAGATYVLLNHGQVGAGYACIPMIFAIALIIRNNN